MLALTVVSTLMVVSPSVLAITLPNGFTFDERPYLQLESRANVAPEKCEHPNDGCSSDCSTQLYCDGNSNAVSTYPCSAYAPYCVRNGGSFATCSGNFPMDDQPCLTRATNNFICTDNGEFPDPTDCSKYHVCNGTSHSIKECTGNGQFTYDRNIPDPYMNPGNGEYRCRFRRDQESCMCDRFYCDGMANSFTFRSMDYFHYAYCLEIGTLKKVIMFKCLSGTKHEGMVSTLTNSVDCVPIVSPSVA